MKTPPPTSLERDESGAYAGSIGSHQLSAEEKRQVRRTLAGSIIPLHIGEIAYMSGVPVTNPSKHQALAVFVESFLTGTKEVQMSFEKNRRGQEVFVGWQSTAHGKDLLQKGLV